MHRRSHEILDKVHQRIVDKALHHACGASALEQFIVRLQSFEYGVLNYCECPLGPSPLEGANHNIEVTGTPFPPPGGQNGP